MIELLTLWKASANTEKQADALHDAASRSKKFYPMHVQAVFSATTIDMMLQGRCRAIAEAC